MTGPVRVGGPGGGQLAELGVHGREQVGGRLPVAGRGRGRPNRRVTSVMGPAYRSAGRRHGPPDSESSFKIVPMPRFLVNSELLLMPNRSR